VVRECIVSRSSGEYKNESAVNDLTHAILVKSLIVRARLYYDAAARRT